MKNTSAIIAVAIFAGASLLLTGSFQTVKAEIPSNANTVGQTVNNNGFQSSSNQQYMQTCKGSQSAQACATSSIGAGPFTSGLACGVNKPR
jgi:hypothetical protein